MSATTSLSSLRATFAPVAGVLTVGVAVLGALFFPEVQAAVSVWLASTAYGHCFLILPMALYLAWDRREALAGLQAQPSLRFALLAVPVAGAWFAAERLGIMEGRQIAAVAGLEVLFLAVLGWRLFRTLAGPLLYLFFLVPFGAFITPALQGFTAGFIRVGLHVLGIPAYITNLTIEISAGTFYVAEACAGLRFLIAAVAFGVFYALLNYRSPGRRAVFIAASIVVPILANGVRALGIVVLGNILGSAEAAAADHIIYGWGFFSVIMLLLVVGGMPWREPPALPRPGAARRMGSIGPLWPALAACVLCAAGPAMAGLLSRGMAPGQFAAVPVLAPPPGCSAGAAGPAVTDQAVVRYQCGAGGFNVTVSIFPAPSTPAQLARECARLTIPAAAEDTETMALATADPDNGQWALVESKTPDGLVAFATWVGGAPARGGLAGRLHQAVDSLIGPGFAPVLITAAPDAPGRIGAAERARLVALLRGFVDAQHGLTEQVRRVSSTP